MFDGHTSKSAGVKGGIKKSTRKRKASQANGAKGGRPSSRLLAERLLGKKISEDDKPYLNKAWSDLFEGEKQELAEHFGVPYQINGVVDMLVWKSKSRRMPRRISYIVARFKLAADYHLAGQREKKPKEYVVEYQQPSPERKHMWDARHRDSGIPCPPEKVRIYFRSLPGFEHIEFMFKRGYSWTVEEILESFGAQWTPKRAKGAISWLAVEYPQNVGDITQI